MKNKVRIIWFFWFVIFLAIVVYVAINIFYQKKQPSIKAEINLSQGFNLYQQNCASCHSSNLEGQVNWQNRNKAGFLPAPPHDETGHTWHHDDLTLFNITKYGGQWALDRAGIKDWKSGMPAFEKTLSDEEIQWTLNYIKSTWSKKIQQIQERRNP